MEIPIAVVSSSGPGHHPQKWALPSQDSGLESCPGGQQGLRHRQFSSQNRKLSKALISSLPIFKTSNADTLSTARQSGHCIALSAEPFSPASLGTLHPVSGDPVPTLCGKATQLLLCPCSRMPFSRLIANITPSTKPKVILPVK